MTITIQLEGEFEKGKKGEREKKRMNNKTNQQTSKQIPMLK